MFDDQEGNRNSDNAEQELSPLIFIGDSHLGALNLGVGQLAEEQPNSIIIKTASFQIFDVGNTSREMMLDLADGREVITSVLVKVLHRPVYAPGRAATPQILNRWTLKSPLSGKKHNIVFLLGFVEMHWFAFYPEWQNFGINAPHFRRQDAREGLYMLPRGLVRGALEQHLRSVFRVIEYLRAKGLNISTLMGPPPVKSNAFIKKYHPGFSPPDPAIRAAIYQSLIDIFEQHAKDYRFFNFSEKFIEDGPYLAEQYSADGIHANAMYGAEVLKLLEREVCQN